jgi:translation initiation factor 5B
VKIPGILVIDTPGHEVFANLRRRGGSAADIAVLVIDVIKGFEAQTSECINILKARKTPFVVAANKIDLIPGWKPNPQASFTESFKKQPPEVQRELNNRLYTIMGSFSRLGFKSDRFDNVKDFTTTVAIVPTSAVTGEGIPELMAILVGLTQTFMKDELTVTFGPAKGTVLEVKEELGLGATINAIIYDGVLKVNDRIALAGKEGFIVTSVRAILLPKPLDEIRDPRDKFSSVAEIAAASSVKIAAPNLENALAGSPLYVAPEGEPLSKFIQLVNEEVEKLKIKTDKIGVIVKADTLGSLEALITSLTNLNIPIRIADIGDVSRREVIEAETVRLKDPSLGAILAFNVKLLPDAEEEAKNSGTPTFQSNVIYQLIEDYVRWLEKDRAMKLKAELDLLIKPGKIRIIQGCVFRKSKPAIVGVEILAGRIRPKYPLILENGKKIGEIIRIQDKGKDIDEATVGMQVAISIDKPIVGRHIFEGDTIYVLVPEPHVKTLLSKFKDQLSPEEIEALNHLIEIMRREKFDWAF